MIKKIATTLVILTFAVIILKCITPERYQLLDPKKQYPVWGIDVSHHQGEIGWDKVKAEGVYFAFIKATEGRDFTDPRLVENVNSAVRNKIPIGLYHFFTLCTSGKLQAKNFISAARKALINAEYIIPPVIDLEFVGNCSRRPSAEQFKFELESFTRLVYEEFGARPIIYTTYGFFNKYLQKPDYKTYSGLWIREIFFSPLRFRLNWARWSFWQYSQNGIIDGIKTDVDLNVFGAGRISFEKMLRANIFYKKERVNEK